MVQVKPSMTFTNPNGNMTASSVTSELNCLVSTATSIHLHKPHLHCFVFCVAYLMAGYDSGMSTVEQANPTYQWSASWSEVAWLDSKMLRWGYRFISKVLVRVSNIKFWLMHWLWIFQCVWRNWRSTYLQCIWSRCVWSWSGRPDWRGSDTQSGHPLWLWTEVNMMVLLLILIRSLTL